MDAIHHALDSAWYFAKTVVSGTRGAVKSFCQREDQLEIIGRLKSLRSTDGPQWGRMYAGAMVRHLVESHEMAMQQLAVKTPSTSLIRGPHGRWLALRMPLQWGKNMPTLPEINIMLRQNFTIDFSREQATLLELIDAFCKCPADALRPEHPLLGRFTREDWMRWGYIHADHHLRQFAR